MIRCLLAFVFFALATVHADSAVDFDAANRLYEKGDYAAAAAAYEKLASGGKASAALLFNLGNAHFKNGHVGRAIVAYNEAAKLAPRDPDIWANLQFARRSVSGNSDRVSGFDRAASLLTLNELGSLTAIAMWGCFGSLALAQLRPAMKSGLKTIAVGAGIFALFFGIWFGYVLLDRQYSERAVVTVSSSAVRFGPLEESQVSFNVRDGAELKVLGRKDKWTQVVDASNRSGWIVSSDLTALP